MFKRERETYLYQDCKSNNKMYKFLDSRPDRSTAVKSGQPFSSSYRNYNTENTWTSNFEYKNRNSNHKSRNQFDFSNSDWNKGALCELRNDSNDNLDRYCERGRHLSQTSSSSGSELKYSSFVEDVMSQSSERESLSNFETRSNSESSGIERGGTSLTGTQPYKEKGNQSGLASMYKSRVSFENPIKHSIMSDLIDRKLKRYSETNTNRMGTSTNPKEWNALQRKVYCDYVDYENRRWNVTGIVNLDKNQMGQLEEENDKLRKKMSEFQRENIKLKEDFNELKIYNDKAQQTIKDLKSCLEDARTERNQMMAEINKLKEQSKNNNISSIINSYSEKGLYEDAEKDHLAERERSRSPNRFFQPRSVSPVFSRPVTPVRASSPVRMTDHSYTAYNPGSRSQTPTPCSFSYEDLSPDGHEIYPHRRTRSYVQKFGAQDVSSSQVDLNDPEITELLKHKTRLTYDLDGNQGDGPQAKRKLLYSPYMDKDFVPRNNQNEYTEKEFINKQEKKETSHWKSEVEEEWESKKFIDALDHAVKQTPAQLAQQRFLQELSSTGDDSDRWRSPSKGILKNTKSAQNMSIKENTSPSRRSFESRSYSPSVRSPLTYSPQKPSTRSYTPEPLKRSYGSPTRSFNNNISQSMSFSPNNRNRSQSPRSVGQRSYSPGNRSSSPGYRSSTTKDSGYSTPTQPLRYRSSVVHDNRDYNRPRTPTSARSHAEKKSGLLSDEERRYADLLIDKYTRQHIIGIPLASS